MNDKPPALIDTLRRCPSRAAGVSRELWLAGWGELQRAGVAHLSQPTAPMLAALVLHDDQFRQLLNLKEREQLQGLIQLALDRYEQQTNPPNQLGKLLAGTIQKE